MKFGIFDYIDQRDEPLHQLYDERIALIKTAEAAGFYGYHVTEHHLTPLSGTPSPSVFLGAAARETRRIRLGALLYLLPLYHPLRLLEEICMLDHLSGGRLEFGVGRGIAPPEFDAFDVDIGPLASRLRPCAGGAVSGLHPRAHRLHLRPLCLHRCAGGLRSRCSGRIRRCGTACAATTARCLPRSAGMNGVTLGPDDKCAATLAAFRRHWAACAEERRQFNTPVREPMVGVMRTMFIADSDADAERIARPAYARWYDSLGWLWEKRGLKLPISISADFDQSRADGTLVVGSPDTVARIFETQAQTIKQNYLVLMLAFGSLTHAQEMHSLDLFRREVMPRLAGLNTAPAEMAAA